MQREQAAAQQRIVDDAFRDTGSMDSTIFDYVTDLSSNTSAPSDGGSDNEITEVEVCAATAGICVVEDVAEPATANPELTKTEALAALREARQRAHARRVSMYPQSGSTNKQLHAECSDKAQLLETARVARRWIAVRKERASLRKATDSAPTSEPFAVKICTVGGDCHSIDGLYSDTLVSELVDRVADVMKIPSFAVRLLWQEQILHMSQPLASLDMFGIEEGSELSLAKNFGWAKPDVTKLHELGK